MTAPRRNVELKARDADPAGTLERALELGAEDAGELVQRDTYFAGTRAQLKLREQDPGPSALIAYQRADAATARPSSYRLVPVADPAALRETLDDALGTTVVVAKRRRLLVWEGVRIHLDAVEGLGAFVELEAVAPDDSNLEHEHGLVATLRAELGIADDAMVATGYADLLLDAPDALLRAAGQAMRHAYAPYSKLKVGAALRGAGGGVFVGANVENSAYPQSQCAEASALGALVTAGETEIAAIAVVADGLDAAPPCGGCCQRLHELARPDTPLYLGQPGGPLRTLTLGELLPLPFDAHAKR